MSRFVAVGDIHGCSQTLAKLLEILELGTGDTLLSTGDLSSKGEDSRGVHDQLLRLEAQGVNLIVLLGNHELMLLAMQRLVGANVNFTAFPESMFRGADVSFLMRSNETWATLKSYGLECAEDPDFWAFRSDNPDRHFEKISQRLNSVDWKLPQTHLDLLCRCKTHHIERNCFVRPFRNPPREPSNGQCTSCSRLANRRRRERAVLEPRLAGANPWFPGTDRAWTYAAVLFVFISFRIRVLGEMTNWSSSQSSTMARSIWIAACFLRPVI